MTLTKITKTIYFHFLVFVLIYIEFGYQMVVAAVFPGSVRMLIILATTLPLIFMIKSIKISSIILFFYLFALILLNSIRDTSIDNSIMLLVPIFIGFLIANSIKLLDLAKIYNNIVVFLAAFSIITFLLSLMFPLLIQKLPFLGYRLDSHATMHNAVFSVCISNTSALRNYGIAWEPGAFSVLLCLSLYCLLAFESKVNRIKLLIIIVAIITTFSTMGYFVMAGILLAFMFKQKDSNKNIKKTVVAFLLLFVVLLLVLPASIKDIVFSKLSGLFSEEKEVAYTTQARLNAIKYPFEAFCSSPIVGVGYDSFSYINKTLCDGVATNTIINWFALLGILLGAPCTYCYIKFVLKASTHTKMSILSKCILLLSAVLMVSTESLLRISLIYIFIFYGCGNQLEKSENENPIYFGSL